MLLLSSSVSLSEEEEESLPLTLESVSEDSEVILFVCFATFGGDFGVIFAVGLGCLLMDPNFTVLSSSDSLSEDESFCIVLSSTASEESDCSLDSSVELSDVVAEETEETVDTEEAADKVLLVFFEDATDDTEEAADKVLWDFFEDATDDDFFEEDTEDEDTVEVVEIILCVLLAFLLCSFFALTFLKNLWIVIAAATISAG